MIFHFSSPTVWSHFHKNFRLLGQRKGEKKINVAIEIRRDLISK